MWCDNVQSVASVSCTGLLFLVKTVSSNHIGSLHSFTMESFPQKIRAYFSWDHKFWLPCSAVHLSFHSVLLSVTLVGEAAPLSLELYILCCLEGQPCWTAVSFPPGRKTCVQGKYYCSHLSEKASTWRCSSHCLKTFEKGSKLVISG